MKIQAITLTVAIAIPVLPAISHAQDLPPQKINLYTAEAFDQNPAAQGWAVFNQGPTGDKAATVIDGTNSWGITGVGAGDSVGNGHYVQGIDFSLLRDGEGNLLPWALEINLKIGDNWNGAGGGNDFLPMGVYFQTPTSESATGNRTWNVTWANDPVQDVSRIGFLNQSAAQGAFAPTVGGYIADIPFQTITMVMDPTGNSAAPANPELLSVYVNGSLIGSTNYWTTSRFANPGSHGGIDYANDDKARLIWGAVGGSTGPSENWVHSIDLHVIPEPSTYALFAGLGLLLILSFRRHRLRRVR